MLYRKLTLKAPASIALLDFLAPLERLNQQFALLVHTHLLVRQPALHVLPTRNAI